MNPSSNPGLDDNDFKDILSTVFDVASDDCEPGPSGTQTHKVSPEDQPPKNNSSSSSDRDSDSTSKDSKIKPEPNTCIYISSDDESPIRKYTEMLTRHPSPAGASQTASGLHTTAVSGGTGVIVRNQGGQFDVPGPISEDEMSKRKQRLWKNRKASAETRRKKKDYVKCLENRVTVLQDQNKTLIEELRALKELITANKDNEKTE